MALQTRASGYMTIADEELCWQVIQSRDTSMDGVFVTAVRTTGVYCRPSCSARMPKRENVTFFSTPDEAEAAGYRACKRCKPRDVAADERPELIRQACEYLEEDPDARVSLTAVADRFGVRAEYLRRLFKRTLGVTPRDYAANVRATRLKENLRDGASVTQAMYDAGYPGTNRLYESADMLLGMTPTAYRKGASGLVITYQVADCVLGRLLVAATARGICSVRLDDSDDSLLGTLRREFPGAVLVKQPGGVSEWVQEIVRYLDGKQVRLDLPVDIQATAFQIRVWRSLRSIAYGETKSYSEVAKEIGMPKATRAVARACATNPIPLIIPCHRVIRNDGSLGGYGLGIERKIALLEMESEHAAEERTAATG